LSPPRSRALAIVLGPTYHGCNGLRGHSWTRARPVSFLKRHKVCRVPAVPGDPPHAPQAYQATRSLRVLLLGWWRLESAPLIVCVHGCWRVGGAGCPWDGGANPPFFGALVRVLLWWDRFLRRPPPGHRHPERRRPRHRTRPHPTPAPHSRPSLPPRGHFRPSPSPGTPLSPTRP